ncbi:P-loop containing nucleoside triphosphate hydrolase protein [Aspergillus pseudoustus]|uniref:P-loop containing nucleoside triphosphate hydrolase protein n=1 Tax=Aspergillus pseudoustus TaxID=1810923 RepID=A0ABR4J7K0_9EURO
MAHMAPVSKASQGGTIDLWICKTFCLGIVQLVLTTQWARQSTARTDASIPINALLTFASFLFDLLSYTEHSFSVTPSFLLNVYLLVTFLFDIAKTRTLWLRQTGGVSENIAILTSVIVALKVPLLVLEAVEKRSILSDEYRAYPPEATAGIFSRTLFWWLNPLFQQGFARSLAVGDVYVLDKQLSSKRLHSRLETSWSQVTQSGPNAFLLVAFKTFKWQIGAAILPRALLAALNFCQPLLLHRSLTFSMEPVTNETNNTGYGLIGAYILVYIGMGVTLGQQQHLTYRAITMIRGAVVSMVYKKACTLDLKDADPAESVTLMSADIERIVQGWQTMHEMWANVAEISLAIFLLKRELGIACVVPVGVSVVALVGCLIAMALVVARQAMWLEAIERRISTTSSMLGSMKGIKMLGLQSSLMKLVHGLRIEELNISGKFRKLLVWNMAFAWLTRVSAPIFAFGAFVGIQHSRGNDSASNTTTVYTALSVFALLADPLLSLVMALMAFAGSVGSFARIQAFLEKDSHVDSRNQVLIHPSYPLKSEQFVFVGQSEVALSESDCSETSKGSSPSLVPHVVAVQNGTFGWHAEKQADVKNVTITIPIGSLAMLIGPSGCGKSTLLKAILGEVPCRKGNIQLSTESVAYCDQTPWHMNGTIQECITGMSVFDSAWYTSVVDACALSKDLELLPRGDETIIGSKGISPSGGQTVYARKKFVILDDVFSSLDAVTENHIFLYLLGDHGLLHSLGTTVLLASSSVKRVPLADYIVALDKHGYITEQGSFSALNSAGGYISSFALESSDTDIKTDGKHKSETTAVSVCPLKKDLKAESASYRGEGDISVYLYYIRSMGWLSTILFGVAISGFTFSISFPSIWVKWWASSNGNYPGKDTGYYLGIYAVLGVVGMLCLIAGAWFADDHHNGTKIRRGLPPKSPEDGAKQDSAPMLFFSVTDSGSILNRFNQDLQLIDMELPIAAINTFANLEAKAPFYSHFMDMLGGLITLRAFGWQQSLQEKHYQLLDLSQRPFYFLYAVQRWLTLTLDLVVAGIAVLHIILVVTLRGNISAGYVGVALLNVIMFRPSIKLLVTFWTNLETHIGSIQRVKLFTETVVSEDLPTERDPVPTNWPAKGNIEFKSLFAEYRSSEPVLSDISISIKAGEKVGICGRTGSGKTSLIMSLFRMLDLQSGSIAIDGIDITRLPRQEIRTRLNGVSQSSLLLKGSVRYNANPTNADTISDKAIFEALGTVNLHTKVLESGGLDADIVDIHLSHGQRQLFCLARAILRSGNILILDSAMSNVDTRTDELTQRVIREKFSSHTVLTVAHKLESILDYDKVVVLEEGRILEIGVPYDLLSQDKSHFRKLYSHMSPNGQRRQKECLER